jgi:DNA topoisomerase-3
VVFRREADGFRLNETRLRELLNMGHTLNPVPVKDSEGQPGLARIEMNKDGSLSCTAVKGKGLPKGKKTLAECPICGGKVFAADRGYACSNQSLGCPLFISKVIAKRKMTQEEMKTLLSEGTTGRLEGFTSRAGKPFSARLILKEGRAVFDFG